MQEGRYIFLALTHRYGVFDNELFEAGVTQLNERHSLEYNRVTPVESGSLSNTSTTYVLTLIMHAEFKCLICYVLSSKCNKCIPSKLPFYSLCVMLIVRSWWHQLSCLLITVGTPLCAPLWCHKCFCYSIMLPFMKSNEAISLVEKSKLLMNVIECLTHVLFKHFTTTPQN